MWLEQHHGIEVRGHCGALALQHAEPISGFAEQRVLNAHLDVVTDQRELNAADLPDAQALPQRHRGSDLTLAGDKRGFFWRSTLTCTLAGLFSAGQGNCCFETATGRRSLNAPYKAAPTPATTDQTAPRYAPSKAKTMPTVMYTYSVPAAEESLNFAPQELQMCPGLFSKEFRFSLRRSADWHFGHE